MKISRRSFLAGLALTGLTRAAGTQPLIDATPPLPRTDAFEAGDFLWPKKPGVFVPYSQQTNLGPHDDRRIWEGEKREFLEKAPQKGSYLSPEKLDDLRRLDYREFIARYHGDQIPGVPGLYSSGGGVYVGHVAIIDIASNGDVWVIEALWERGVVRQAYSDWIAGRPGEVVWLGRLRERTKQDRSIISAEAKKHIGKPYVFWNFNLNDDAGFYCSKLVWLSIFRGLRFSVDGNENPQRDFWFSPKQLLYLPIMERIHDPGPYAHR
jgi:hypothetical protein